MESLFVDKLENPFVTANVDKTANVMSGTTYNNVFRKFFVKLISRKITSQKFEFSNLCLL